MNYPASGGETTRDTGAVAGEIRITIEAIRKIATDNMTAMRENADSQASDFRSTHLPGSAFGDTPIGQSVASLHTAAHDVFKQTIDGVIQDLETFAANLVASCKAHEETDQQSADDARRAGQGALSGLAAPGAPGQYHADQHFDESSQQHDEAIPDAPAYQHESAQPGQSEGADGPADQPAAGGDSYAESGDSGSDHSEGGGSGDSYAESDTTGSTSTPSSPFTSTFSATPLADSDGDGLIDAIDVDQSGFYGDASSR